MATTDHALQIEQRATNCRCCSVGCGILVDVQGDRVLDVRGDPDHPLSKGYTCSKGRGLATFHHSPRRLDSPLLHGRTSDWGDCLDDLAQRCQALIAEHGPSSLGYYSANGHVLDTAGYVTEARFFGTLGPTQHYTATTVDISPAFRAAEIVIGTRELHPQWVPEHEGPDLLLVIGLNPVISHGYLTPLTDPVRRIRSYRDNGGQVWVMDPRRTETAVLADRHLAPLPGSDGAVLAWLIRELLTDGACRVALQEDVDSEELGRVEAALAPFRLESVAAATGLEATVLQDLLQAIRSAGQIAVISGTGMTFGRHALVTEWLQWVLLIITGSLDRPGGMAFDPGWLLPNESRDWSSLLPIDHAPPGPASRPELSNYFGEVPAIALVDEIEAGNLRGLFISGGSPLTALPDPARTEAALRSLDLLVVLDVLANPHTEIATHVLPVAGQLERSDFSLRLRAMYAQAVVRPATERRPSWWIYAQLAERMGIDVLDGAEPDSLTDEDMLRRIAVASRGGADMLFASGPHGIEVEQTYGWVREHVLPDGRWRIAPQTLIDRLPELLEIEPPALRLVSRRERDRNNSVHYASRGPTRTPRVLVHPDDAASLGLAEGTEVQVTSAAGAIDGTIGIDAKCAPGAVSITHGWVEPNVDNLVSGTEEIDPLTGQPVMTGFTVTLAART